MGEIANVISAPSWQSSLQKDPSLAQPAVLSRTPACFEGGRRRLGRIACIVGTLGRPSDPPGPASLDTTFFYPGDSGYVSWAEYEFCE